MLRVAKRSDGFQKRVPFRGSDHTALDSVCAMNSQPARWRDGSDVVPTLPAALPPRGWQSHEEGLAREQELPRERAGCERVRWQLPPRKFGAYCDHESVGSWKAVGRACVYKKRAITLRQSRANRLGC